MSDWDLPLVEYWDQTTGAINRNARRLIHLGEAERTDACDQIRDAIRKRVHALADDPLLQATVSMVDDLYKFVNDEVLIDKALFAYLDAFARTFTTAIHDRGYVIHYVVENRFSGVDFLMRGPFDLFPRVFNAAGFVYVCPQHIALQLMQADGVAAPDYARVIAQYTDEARVVGDRLVSRCHETGQHYMFLEADYQEGALDAALQDGGAGGVLIIFRNDAPVPDSTVSVRFPESLT